MTDPTPTPTAAPGSTSDEEQSRVGHDRDASKHDTAGADVAPGLMQAQREAIEISGWGARFGFVQPHNACFWVFVFLLASGLWRLVGLVVPTGDVFAVANGTSLLTSGLFCVVFLIGLHWADRWERTPGRLALVAFLGGGLIATWAIALAGNDALRGIYSKLFGQPWAEDWRAGLAAPFVEETAKGAIVLLMLGLAPVVIRTVYDGLIVGAYVGLGFQVFEDMLYGQNNAFAHFGVDQAGSVLDTFARRAATGIASHALYTALFAAGLIYLIGTVAQPRRVGRGVALIAAALVVHGVWDNAAALGGGTIFAVVILVVVTLVSVVILFVAIRWGSNRERGYLQAILGPEVANGTVTQPELEELMVRRRPARAQRSVHRHVLTALRDLGNAIATDAHSQPSDHSDRVVEHARSEVVRLRETTRSRTGG